MKPHQMMTIAVQLERDLADFYKQLSNAVGFEKYHDIFMSMFKHSQHHADIINGLAKDFNIPELDVAPMQELHEKIKDRLIQQLKKEQNLAVGRRKMAEAEDILGKIYLTISANYERAAQTYQRASEQFNELAEDEQRHRDQLLAVIDMDQE